MNRWARVGILAASVVIFGWVGLGHVLGRTANDKAYKSLVVYGEVLQKIQQDYVDEPNMHLVEAGSLHGLLESLDSESSYLTPREYTEYKQKTSSPGTGETGLNLSKRFGYIIVTSALPDSPADKAGLHSGDIFESVAGFTTREMSVGQAQNLLSGPIGSGVKVGVIRRGKTDPDEVELVRTKLAPSKLVVEKIDTETIAFRFPSIEAGRTDELRAHLQEASKQGVTKVILDVRECGRGSVPEAIAMARLFVPSGNLTSLKGQTIPTQDFPAEPARVVWRGPVSILMDGTTTGAAEILAASIANTKRGDLVGDRTFGLASEQKLITMDDGSAIILTIANYFNADGKPILEEGVTPTEVVHSAANAADDGDDGDDSTSTTQKDQPLTPRPLSSDDLVLRRALELLKNPTAAKKAA
jgi:carboxyl-terminal processing protease